MATLFFKHEFTGHIISPDYEKLSFLYSLCNFSIWKGGEETRRFDEECLLLFDEGKHYITNSTNWECEGFELEEGETLVSPDGCDELTTTEEALKYLKSYESEMGIHYHNGHNFTWVSLESGLSDWERIDDESQFDKPFADSEIEKCEERKGIEYGLIEYKGKKWVRFNSRWQSSLPFHEYLPLEECCEDTRRLFSDDEAE